MNQYPQRLIEIDLPIKRISAHARREKSIRHGHISTLHIWWARRPLAACRAVICAALWPDPADPLCPPAFREAAAILILDFARKVTSDTRLADEHCSPENFKKWTALVSQDQTDKALRRYYGEREDHVAKLVRDIAEGEVEIGAQTDSPSLGGDLPADQQVGGRGEGERSSDFLWLRSALLDFIADFANWDNSTVREYLDTSRALTGVAHASLIDPDFTLPPDGPDFLSTLNHQLSTRTKPLLVDPFAGGGSIPLEALRVGADAFASDLNPVAVLLNKVVLEYIPKYGQRLADEVRKWGEWIKREAEKELAEFYPKDADGATPIAYLWARTIQCEGPGCGVEVPLIRSLWLAKKPSRSVTLQIVPNKKDKRVDFQIIVKKSGTWVDQANHKTKIADPKFEGMVKRGSATCPCCGYTTPVARVREQLKSRRGGTKDGQLFCVVTSRKNELGRFFRLPNECDLTSAKKAVARLEKKKREHKGKISLVPDEKLDLRGIRHTWAMIYGLQDWSNYYTDRQALALTTLTKLVVEAGQQVRNESDNAFANALQTCLAMVLSREADKLSSIARWDTTRENPQGTFARQALPMLWDFNEVNPLSGSGGDWDTALDWVHRICESQFQSTSAGTVERASAAHHPMPSDSAHLFVTDPPYYDAVPYAYLSDFFYVWLRRALGAAHPDLFTDSLVPKDEEIVVDRPHELSNSMHDIAFYERELTKAFSEGRRVLRPDGVGTIVFASKTTASWEAILKAVVDAGWIITGSWPIDTELENRVSAQGQARLASSVHLVCRPRENPDGSVQTDEIGDWRNVLQELPHRIHEWMPRLAEEGVVGADAIFACLGPALEIFSRYSRVEKASGEAVTLKEYLEHVWAAVAKEALALVFKDADTSGFEPDARLTAMWLWTLSASGGNDEGRKSNDELDTASGEDEEDERKAGKTKGGFVLEYDAVRKIAQGLGAHLEDLGSLVEVSGEQARLLPVGERAHHLFGKDEGKVVAARKKKEPQMDLFKVLQQADEGGTRFGESKVERHGETVLDRIHQSMILFAAGRGEALKRFLVEDGVGRDQRFWRLAQALSALYPGHTEEKRWVDGVLARKKGLGF
jgi:putative DNA methylase